MSPTPRCAMMLERLAEESRMGNYGIYFGTHEQGACNASQKDRRHEILAFHPYGAVSAEDRRKQLYDEMLELCRIADEGGMHAIWTGEHHGMNFTIAPNPLLNLVDLARRTRTCAWAPAR
jgi:hypothetical protein